MSQNIALPSSSCSSINVGYKGMVVIDYQLEGITMRLRPSMRKFEVPEQKEADIEIARAFERPGKAYLNR